VDPANQIAMLEGQRKVLADQLDGMHRKMDQFKERVAERELEKAKAQSSR
jgi:hypothetical protein